MRLSLGPQLEHRLDQGLRLSPEMHSSLRILGLSLREVGLELRTALESNPCLEEDESESPETEDAANEADREDPNEDELDSEALSSRFDDFPGTEPRNERERQGAAPEPTWPTFEPVAPGVSLADHLLQQIAVSPAKPEVKVVARLVVGNLNEDGFLEATPADLLQLAQDDLGVPVAPEVLPAALALVRSLDPIGVGWCDRQASLLAQLRSRGCSESELSARLIREAWDLLVSGHWDAVLRELKIGRPALVAALGVVRSLDWRPGARFAACPPAMGLADLVVRRIGSEHVVEVNDGGLPRLRLSDEYLRLSRSLKGSSGEEASRRFLREHLASGAILLRNVHRRSVTLGRIGKLVFERQADFLEEGLCALRPLQMTEIAQELNLCVSTVSRAVADKYVTTPRGTFPLRIFFDVSVPTQAGEATAGAAARERVRALIEAEAPGAPLTDAAIRMQLQASGVELGLSTVRKYREAFGIPPSHIRRQLQVAV